MAYIGVKPTIGNFQICDAISVVNGQAAYTMQVGSVNVSPQSANHMIVSLNGVIQKPGSSYTVSGNTITFASNLATGDVIDFIQILGDVLDLGVPSDATVTAAKLTANSITGQTAETSIATDDTVLIHDTSAGALRKMTRANFVSGIGGTNTPMFMAYLSANQSVSDNTIVKVQCDTEAIDTDNAYDNSTNYRFTVPSGAAGKYLIYAVLQSSASNDQYQTTSYLYKNGSVYSGNESNPYDDTGSSNHAQTQWILDLSEGDYLEFYGRSDQSDNAGANFAQTTGHIGSPTAGATYFGGYKLIT